MVPFLTGGMRPLTSWWKNVVEGAWLESFVEQSLRHSPGLLLSLGINYIKVLNFYLFRSRFCFGFGGAGAGHRLPCLQQTVIMAATVP